MLTTLPRPRSAMPGSTQCSRFIPPIRLIEMIFCQNAGSVLRNGLNMSPPAVFTKMSTGPAAATAFFPAAYSGMSMLGSPFRSNTTTFVPSALKRSTMAAPMPAAPPVTMAVFPLRPRISLLLEDHCSRLELDLSGRVEQVRDEDHAHRRIVPAHEPFPDAAELGPRREVGRLVAAVGRHAADMLRAAARFGEHRKRVLERLLELLRDLFRMKPLRGIPSDLTGDEHQPPGRRFDAVRVADRRRPARRMQRLHSPIPGGSGAESHPAP